MQLHHEFLPDGTAALHVTGELTIYSAAELKAALLPLATGARDLTLDLAGVTDIDSAGIQVLLAARLTLAGHGASLYLAGSGGAVVEALSLYGIADAFRGAAPV